MKRTLCFWLIGLFCISTADFSRAETTLEKIDKSGTLIIGTRTGSPPFAYVNSKNEWVGFTIDLVEAESGKRGRRYVAVVGHTSRHGGC